MTCVCVLITWCSDRIFMHRIMLWPVLLFHIFLSNLVSGMIFAQNVFTMKYVFWFFYNVYLNIFLIPQRIQRYIIINILRSSCKVSDILSDFNQTWIIWHILMKMPYITFHVNPSSENWVVPCSWMDRRDLANSHCYEFWEHSQHFFEFLLFQIKLKRVKFVSLTNVESQASCVTVCYRPMCLYEHNEGPSQLISDFEVVM
jgi:hypothetical protein